VTPSPSEIREARIRHLVVLAEKLVARGVEYALYDRVERASWRLWPTLGSKTRRSYVQSALRIVLEGSREEPVLPEAIEPSQEATRS
jgi:ribulose bisphosphate carboxylase small subunit